MPRSSSAVTALLTSLFLLHCGGKTALIGDGGAGGTGGAGGSVGLSGSAGQVGVGGSSITGTCISASLACADGDGFACTGNDTPDEDFPGLTCSEDQGAGLFCCVEGGTGGAASGCVFDPIVTSECSGSTVGYSCPTSTLPSDTDTSLNCSDDVGTGEFCCTNFSATCLYDPALACDAGSGFRCAGSDEPQDDFPGITCSSDQGSGTFCCVADGEGGAGGAGGSGGACAPDASVDCTEGVGYSCPGSENPEDGAPELDCSDDIGTGQFCCVTEGAGGGVGSGACVFDPEVTGQCTGNAAGYSCSGSALPSEGDPSLGNCSDDIGTGEFCCNGPVVGTCEVDLSLAESCAEGAGYSCSGADRPEDDFPGIVCLNDQGTGTFCCNAD